MAVTITPQSIITLGAVVAAVIALVGYMLKVHKWFLKQEQQSNDIEALRNKHDDDINDSSKSIAEIKAEQTILVYGILACLKGLKEQGCNGPVTEAINTIEKHLNQKAHK